LLSHATSLAASLRTIRSIPLVPAAKICVGALVMTALSVSSVKVLHTANGMPHGHRNIATGATVPMFPVTSWSKPYATLREKFGAADDLAQLVGSFLGRAGTYAA
jgi:hypothetical protein